MKYNSLKNKIAAYTLVATLTLSPAQSYGFWPFGGKKEIRQEQIDQTKREKTTQYLEKKGGQPLPKIVIPDIMKDDSTFTAPIYSILNLAKPYLGDGLESVREEITNAEINYSRNRLELTDIASVDTLTSSVYGVYSTPRTDISPEEELPLLFDGYANIAQKASQGDTTAIRLKEQLDPYFKQLKDNARIANAVRRSLDEAISPIEKQANKSWGERYWWIITPPVVAAVAGTAAYFLGNNGKGGKEKVYNIGNWENSTKSTKTH